MSSESWRLGEAKLRLDAVLRVMASWRSRAARHGEAVLRTDDIRGWERFSDKKRDKTKSWGLSAIQSEPERP
jgi:hypothetical protein